MTQLFTGYVGAMLQEYAASPAAAWKSKDCAVYLVVALAVRCKTCSGLGVLEPRSLARQRTHRGWDTRLGALLLTESRAALVGRGQVT